MRDEELLSLLQGGESDRAEFKEDLTDTSKRKVRETICAFANDLPGHGKPGVIFVGVKNDGTPAHLPITDELLRGLADLRSNGGIVPFPYLQVEKRVFSGAEVAVIIVHPSDFPPLRCDGRVYVRVGPTTRVATAEEERRLAERRRAGDQPFDLRPVPAATLEDLDLDRFRREYLPAAVAPDVLEQNQRTINDQLMALRFITRDGVPTVLGLLIVGREPRRYVPGAYLQFLRVEGTDLAAPIVDQKELNGPLPDILRASDDLLRLNIRIKTDVLTSPVELRKPDYPFLALQQLLRNAILHRNYEGTSAPVRVTWFVDRVEIHNPGGPYGQVTRENFGTPGVTDYRNPHLAEALRNLGYVQRFGIGIQLARTELEVNGNPPPEFRVEDTYTLAIVRAVA